jgi:hypothetical protein
MQKCVVVCGAENVIHAGAIFPAAHEDILRGAIYRAGVIGAEAPECPIFGSKEAA